MKCHYFGLTVIGYIDSKAGGMIVDKAEKIKNEVLADCHDNSYRKVSILDIYWKNQDYLRSKLKRAPLSPESMEFLANNIQRIEDIYSSVTIEFFRRNKLDNIVAVVGVIDKFGEEQLVKVNAGYCVECGIYFMLESSYEKLKNFGIPMCRVSDEKTYLKTYSVNGMMLAQQSILMQCGYNVNQEEGLSQTRRQKILAVLIDKSILGKSEIISYLDFFISQRQYQDKYQVAISKWEADREFVESYRFGEYHQYGVNAIYRR